MLVFVIPLMSPKLANSWEKVSLLFEKTLKSVCNQTSPNFRVIVVCHEKPKIRFVHPYVSYLEVDLPLPQPSIEAKTLDRGYKVLSGLELAQSFNPSHVMFVDADDCISKHLAKFVEENSTVNGWFINKGYFYKDGSRNIYVQQEKFHHICGTCNIIKNDLYNLDIKNIDFIRQYYGGHKLILSELKEQAIEINALPFIGAVYIVENGENYYNKYFEDLMPKRLAWRLRGLKHYRLLTNSITEEFGLYPISLSKANQI